MQNTKSSIRLLISKGHLKKALASGIEYAEYCGLVEVVNALTALSANFRNHQQKWNTGLIKYEDFSIQNAKVAVGLAEWISTLPDHPIPAKKKKKYLTETQFKSRIFYFLCLIKFLIFLRLCYHWSTGGFNNDQFQGTVALLIPAFAAYISIMLTDYLNTKDAKIKLPNYLAGPLVNFSNWLFPIYGILIILLIEMKTKGTISFVQMNVFLALVESVLGGYIGQIIHAFFRKKS